MKLTKSRIKEIIKEEMNKVMQEQDQGAPAPADAAPRDVATLAQAMERHQDVQMAIERISNAAEAQAAITYLIKKLGEKNLPVAQIITSMAKSLAQTRKGGI